MKNALAPVSILIVSVLLGGCMQVNPSDTDCAPPAPVTRPERFDGQELTILDQGAFDYMIPLIAQPFENVTGAKLRVVNGGDAGTALRTALLSAGNPPADILYGVDNALFFTEDVREQCLFVAYESSRLDSLNRTMIDVDQFRVDGDLWVTPVDHAYVSVNYDIRLDDAENGTTGPKTLRELANTKWAPEFVIPDPRFSSPGLLFLLSTIHTFGETGDYTWQDYWGELFDNGALIVRDWTTAYVYHFTAGYGQYNETTFIGDRHITVSYTTSPATEVYFGTPEVPSVSLEPAGGVMQQIETMGILRGSKNVALAQAFIDFALAHEFQTNNPRALAVYPATTGIELPQEFHDLATDPAKLDLADIGPDEVGNDLDRWVDEWVTLYQEHRA